jgi:uncharacterized protein (DUF983 family)
MQDVTNGRKPVQKERGQGPLYFVIIGLGVVIYSLNMKSEQMQDVVFWGGVVCAVIALLYWLLQPQHGFAQKR